MHLSGTHERQAEDHAEKRGGVDEEAGADAHEGDDDAGDGGTDDLGNLVECGVEADGVGEAVGAD